MKRLYLIRHAKSSWAFDLNDHDRPLGKRGRSDTIKMGQHLSNNQPKPEIIISSTASRAFYTALCICDQMGIDESLIRLDRNLYHARMERILHVVKNSSSCETLAIFGHNPSITNAVNVLANFEFQNIPTCGVVGIHFDVTQWKDVNFGEGELSFFYFPKEI